MTELEKLVHNADLLRDVQNRIQLESDEVVYNCAREAFETIFEDLSNEQKANVRRQMLKLIDVISLSYMQLLFWAAEDIVFEQDIDREVLSNFNYQINE